MEHRSVEEHVTGLRTAVEAFARSARAAGLDAQVPTCSAWTVRKLLAHQGMVHRWARANLRREECHPPSWNAEGQRVADPVAWLLEGADDLAQTVAATPDDVRAMVFLKDAPPPRAFWARRQCHETTIHAVDALAAGLGRFPEPADAGWVDEAVALDGIDELLTGFVTRGTARFADAGPMELEVRPVEGRRGWLVEVGPDGAVVTTRLGRDLDATGAGGSAEPGGRVGPGQGSEAGGSAASPAVVTGSAVGLYLALWNRAAAGAVDDPADVLPTVWRKRARVRWS